MPIYVLQPVSGSCITLVEDAVNELYEADLDYEATDFSVIAGTLTITNSGIDHNATTNYVANQHIDWTAASAAFSTSGGASIGGGVVFNETGAAVDFKVEGDTVDNLLLVKGSTDFIGIGGITAPAARLDIKGSSSLATISGVESLTSDGGFSSTPGGWTCPPGAIETDWLIGVTGKCTHVAGNTAVLTGTTTVASGSLYKIVFTVTGRTVGSFTVALGTGSTDTTVSSNATHTHYAVASGASVNITFPPTTDFDGAIDDISIKLVTPSTASVRVENSDGTSTPVEIRGGGSGQGNLFIGTNTGRRVQSGATSNTFYGSNTSPYLTDGDYNTAYGSYSFALGKTNSYVSAFGYQALYNSTGNGGSAFGYQALKGVTTGVSNSGFGGKAGDNITTGSYNLIMGYDLDAPSATASYQLSIMNAIFGTTLDGAGTTISTGKIGLFDNSPDARCHITTHSSFAASVLELEQLDVDDEFIDFVGTSEASSAKSISSWTVGATIQGYVKVNINGSPFWMAYCNPPTS